MEKSYIQKIIPFIDNMRVQSEGGEPTPGKEGTPFEVGQVYNYAYYNTELSYTQINSILENLNYDIGDEDFKIAQIIIDNEEKPTDYFSLTACRLDKSMFDPEATGYVYGFLADNDAGSVVDGFIYMSETLDVEGTIVEQGWHTTTPGQITLSDRAIVEVKNWDKVNTIFSSTPFEE